MDPDKLKVLFVATEVWPYSKAGGLGDVMGALPPAIRNLGHDARVISPYYQTVEENHHTEHESGGVQVRLGETPHFLDIRKATREGVVHYFIENKFFFRREHIYNYFDDGERFITFCRGTLETLKRLEWRPDVIHCNDWQTGLIPALLKTALADDPFFTGVATVFSIHNLAYQGTFPDEYVKTCGLPAEVFHYSKAESYGRLNFLKMGITYSDLVNTVSPTYKKEILTPEYGEGLDAHLREHSGKLHGILNGLDPARFNPETDNDIYFNYSARNLSGKEENKRTVMDEIGLSPGGRVPLAVIVSRLTGQKGFDILESALESLMKTDLRLAVLGAGDEEYVRMLRRAAGIYPGRISVSITYNPALARKLYAAGDMFLMPSKYEPCGLGQMIAMRYGTVPVVRAAGGLADTVRSFSAKTGHGHGVVFKSYTAKALENAVKRAAGLYSNRKTWGTLMKNCMACDISWEKPAIEYEKMYRQSIQDKS